jgi:hypothetical protein
MSETTKRDPATDPWHPDPRAKAQNRHAVIAGWRQRHLAALQGVTVTAEATPVLKALTTLLAGDDTLVERVEAIVANMPVEGEEG